MQILSNPTRCFTPSDKATICLPSKEDLNYGEQKKIEWQFRIYAQLLKNKSKGYASFFFTLSYSDFDLPRFSADLGDRWNSRTKQMEPFVLSVPCFSRENVRRFIRGIQQQLYRDCGIKDIDYLIASEFGTNTQRPHHHGILSTPVVTNKLDGTPINDFNVYIHSLILKHWSIVTEKTRKHGKGGFDFVRRSLGFVFPRCTYGGRDNNGYTHMPLRINDEDIVKAAKYVCKYCTKDLSYFERKDVNDLYKTLKNNHDTQLFEFRKCLPFLKVSQFFGSCIEEIALDLDKCSWANGVVFGDKDKNIRIAYGVKTPLNDEQNTSIPSYVLNRLFNVRNKVECVEYYPETPTGNYDIFNYELERKIEVSSRKVIKYKYEVLKSDLYREVLPHLYRSKVNFTKEQIKKFYDSLCLPCFDDWVRHRGFFIPSVQYILSFKDKILPMAIYATAFQNRFVPSRLADYFRHESDYCAKWLINEFEQTITINDYYTNEKKSINIIDEVLSEIKPLEDGKEFVNDDWLYDYSSERATLCYPPITGTEDLDSLCLVAPKFYSVNGFVVRSPYPHNFAPINAKFALFNRLPCFNGFDTILFLVRDFHKFYSDLEKAEKKRKKDLEKQFMDTNFAPDKKTDINPYYNIGL